MGRLICILGALREEINLIKGQMTIDEQFKFARADAWSGSWEGTHIVLVRTGIGKELALNALKQALSLVRPSLILSIGYAGGLDPKLMVGDVVLADHVLKINTGHDDCISYPIDLKQLELLEESACSNKVVFHKGKIITVDHVVGDPNVKQELGLRYNALAVDMETAVLVAYAAEQKIPFLSLRGISDTVKQSLVDTSSLISDDGKVSKLKAGWYVIRRPHTIKNFISLREQTQHATYNMTEFIRFFIRTHLNS